MHARSLVQDEQMPKSLASRSAMATAADLRLLSRQLDQKTFNALACVSQPSSALPFA